MDITNDILMGLNQAMEFSTATLSYLSASVPLSASVYSSYGQQIKYETDEFDYHKVWMDFSVMAKSDDVANWKLEPKKSKVYVDGVPYLVGGVVTYTPSIQWISLRAWTNTTGA